MNHSDTSLTDKESDLINALAGRLRLVQAELSDMGGDERRLSIKDEVAHALQEVSTPDRPRILKGLLRRFPVAGQTVGVAPDPPPEAVPPPEPEPETPDALFERFLETCKGATEDQRKDWVQRLAGQGLIKVQVQQSQGAADISAESLKAVGLSAGQVPQMDRVFILLGAVSELLERLDQATDRTLQELSVRRNLVSEKEKLSTAFAEYLVGGEDRLESRLQQFSLRLGALVTGMLVGGRNYGTEFLRRCAPPAIEEVVRTEGRHGFRKSFEVCCWEKYKDLARGFATADLIDRQVKEAMGKVVKGKISR